MAPKASLTGPKTVMPSAPLRAVTSAAFLTAVTKVESSGLAVAAEAAGAVAMPSSEPAPSAGTWSHGGPKTWAAASLPESLDMSSDGDSAGEDDSSIGLEEV